MAKSGKKSVKNKAAKKSPAKKLAKKSGKPAGKKAGKAKKAVAKKGRVPTVAEIMTRKVVVVRPETTLEVAVELMIDEDLSRLPVVDVDGKCIGILTKTDIVAEQHVKGDTQTWESTAKMPLRRGIQEEMVAGHVFKEGETVADVMSKVVLSVRTTDTIANAAKLLVQHHIHGLPVLDGEKVVVGMLSALDLAAWVAKAA